MNLRQPYEQLIADKLRQLHPPDADASWQQMKRLLDDDEDTRVGGRRRPPGNNGLWRIGIVAIVLCASFWLYVDNKTTPHTSLSKNNNTVTQANDKTSAAAVANNSNKTQTNAIDKTTTLDNTNTNNTVAANKLAENPGADKSSLAIADVKNNTNSAGKTALAANAAAIAPGLSATNNRADNKLASAKNNTITNSRHKTAVGAKKKSNDYTATGNVFTGLAIAKKDNHKNKNGQHSFENKLNNHDLADAPAGNTLAGNGYKGSGFSNAYNQKIKVGAGKVPGSNITGDHNLASSPGGDDANDNRLAGNNRNNVVALNQTVAAKEKTWFERLPGLQIETPDPEYNTSLIEADSIAGSPELVLNNETKKAIAKAQRDKDIALLDKKDKKFHLDLSNVFKPFSMKLDAEPWWAAGLALNSGVTLGAQNRYNYNMNAKKSMITDYIPSPYLQFHLNNYVYFQTELNFVTPQYTPQLLAYRQNSEITAQSGMSQQKSIYIQKLYYFNWPVSLHYSPISNLYFSGGIQFSSFQSGLAAIEEKQFATIMGPDHPSGTNTTVLKFKDDSIAAKIAPNEWRWQAGAEYYWNRFSVGLRYNKSFKNSINTIVSPSLPPTVNRNESLLFFVRYNLFESRSKK